MNIANMNAAPKAKDIQVNDIIVHGGLRLWRVTGVYYGGYGEENVAGLCPLDMKPAIRGKETVNEMLVPLALIPRGSVYRPVHAEETVPVQGVAA